MSNFGVTQCELLAARMPGRVAANQIEFSVLKRDALSDGTLDWCQMAGCVPMAWSPLGGGALFTGESTELVRLRAALAAVGREHGGAALEQIALAWLLRHPARVVPVLGTSTPQRVRDAARAATLSLSRQQWYLILEAATGSPVP